MNNQQNKEQGNYQQTIAGLHLEKEKKTEVLDLYRQIRCGVAMQHSPVAWPVVLAACAAVIVTVVVLPAIRSKETPSARGTDRTTGENPAALAASVTGSAQETLAELEHHFSLVVRAAEPDVAKADGAGTDGEPDAENGGVKSSDRILEPGKPAPVVNSASSGGWVLGSTDGDDADAVNYCFSAPLVCVGEGIEAVTWSVNRGCLQVVEPKDISARIVLSGEPSHPGDPGTDPEGNYGQVGGDSEALTDNSAIIDEKTGEKIYPVRERSVAEQYRSFTVAYNRQTDPHTWINLCGVSDVPGYWSRVWSDSIAAQDDDERTYLEALEEEQDCLRTLLKDVVITCTVTYADGTTEHADVTVGAEILPWEEAGIYLQSSDLAGEPTKLPNEERYGVFVTYELQ